MARVPYVNREDLPADKQGLIVSQRPKDELADELKPLMSNDSTRNFYRALGHSPSIVEGFRTLQNAIWNDGGLTKFQREYVILTVAREATAAYVWQNHVRVALDEGVAPEDIVAISKGDLSAFDPSDRTLLEYIVRVLDGTVDDATHAEMQGHFDDTTIIGAAMLATLYHLNALVADALGVEIKDDERWVGWELENVSDLLDDGQE